MRPLLALAALSLIAAPAPAAAQDWSELNALDPALMLKQPKFQNRREPLDPRRVRVTAWEYNKVKPGMDLPRVAVIVGERGQAVAYGTNSLTWAWKNLDGTGMTAVFRDGKLVEKTQEGLERGS